MSTSYYYFAASLPILQFGMKPPFACMDFLEHCQRLLSEEDFFNALRAIREYGGTMAATNKLLRECERFTHNLCNEIAWLRASKAHKNPLDYIRGEKAVEPSIVDVLTQASKIEDPLEAEIFIDQARWQLLDDFVLGHYFDLEFIIVYGLKLKILERHQEIASSKGKETFEKYRMETLEVT